MRKIVLLGIVAAILGAATAAVARDHRGSCTATPASQWLSTSELASKFAAQGYTVQKIELKSNCGEAKLVDKTGARTKVRFDPANAAIVSRQDHTAHRERHDRDDRDDRR